MHINLINSKKIFLQIKNLKKVQLKPQVVGTEDGYVDQLFKKILEQTTIIDRFGSGKNVTQKMLDQKLVNLIIDETLPLAVVDKP